MNLRLLLITVICIICTSSIEAVENFRNTSKHIESTQEQFTFNTKSHISSPEHNVIIPRQTNYTAPIQNRPVSKRHSTPRFSNRYIFFTAGKAVAESFIETYQLAFRHYSPGLMTSYRHHLCLGILII